MKKSFSLLLLFLLGTNFYAVAQHAGFMYGEVILENNQRHSGYIYWSARQRMWVDLLVVEKKNNPLLKYLSYDQLKRLSEEEERKHQDWGFMSLWKNKYPSRELTFRCRFGDIAQIQVTGDKEAIITLKNGEKMNVYIGDEREYQDQLGEEITLYPLEKGKKVFDWEDIDRIRFKPAPAKLSYFSAIPLYGTVTTRMNLSYTGLIQWDSDERLSTNSLNGETRGRKDLHFRFREVQSIRPKDEGALVKFHSGKEIYLQDDRDVDGRNRGIVVRHPTWGQVNIKWTDFKKVVFSPYPGDAGFTYHDFQQTNTLRGSVRTRDNETWKGEIAYELDERLDVETIDGWDNAGALRQVPLRYIKEVYPINEEHTAVILKDGSKLVLGGRSDVSKNNWGALVKLKGDEFKYIPWNEVDKITFD